MENEKLRIDFHTHTIFSDGILLPAGLVREAEIKGHKAIAITDHVDASNIRHVVRSIVDFIKEMKDCLPIKVLPGVEVSYIPPQEIGKYCKLARKLGARIVVVHGESPVEPVYPGTNHTAVQLKGLVDILAHPGHISESDVETAAKNGIYLELSSRKGHLTGNKHVADLAKKYGAKLVVGSDSHNEKDLISQKEAFEIAKNAGLNDEEIDRAIVINPNELLEKALK
jgi:putative hydrolase